MNVKQLKCRICGNSEFHIYNVNDGGVLNTEEYVCTQCGGHHSVDSVSIEYSAAWNQFVEELGIDEDIISAEEL